MSMNLIIIGLGNHTKTKIIPTLEQLSIPILGIVTSTKIEYYNKIKVFDELDEISEKNKITHCIISTTPSKQIMHLKKLQFTNIKIYVEKPAFTNKEDLYSIENLIIKNRSLTEGFMYRFNSGFKYFQKKMEMAINTDYEMNLTFILPRPKDNFARSFRSEKSLKNSIIYDIGSYIFDLLWILGLKDLNIQNLTKKNFENGLLEKITFFLCSNDHNSFKKINVEIGYSNDYRNEIHFESKHENYTITPFFWGRRGKINIINFNEKSLNKVQIETKSALKLSLYKWFNGIEDKMIMDLQCFKRYDFIISQLENLERKILNNV